MILFVAAKYRDDGGKRSMDVTPVSAEGRERHTTPPVDELDILHRVVGDRTVLDHVNVDRHDHRSRWVEKRAFILARPSEGNDGKFPPYRTTFRRSHRREVLP